MSEQDSLEHKSTFSFIDNPNRMPDAEQRQWEILEHSFFRNLEWAKDDIERASDNAVRKIYEAERGGFRFDGASESINELETTIRAALLAVLLAKRSHARRFEETPVTSEAAE